MKVVGGRKPGFKDATRICKQLDSGGGRRGSRIRVNYPHDSQQVGKTFPLFGKLWIESGQRVRIDFLKQPQGFS